MQVVTAVGAVISGFELFLSRKNADYLTQSAWSTQIIFCIEQPDEGGITAL